MVEAYEAVRAGANYGRFCEGLLELAGAMDVHASVRERSSANALRTLVVVRWRSPR